MVFMAHLTIPASQLTTQDPVVAKDASGSADRLKSAFLPKTKNGIDQIRGITRKRIPAGAVQGEISGRELLRVSGSSTTGYPGVPDVRTPKAAAPAARHALPSS